MPEFQLLPSLDFWQGRLTSPPMNDGIAGVTLVTSLCIITARQSLEETLSECMSRKEDIDEMA